MVIPSPTAFAKPLPSKELEESADANESSHPRIGRRRSKRRLNDPSPAPPSPPLSSVSDNSSPSIPLERRSSLPLQPQSPHDHQSHRRPRSLDSQSRQQQAKSVPYPAAPLMPLELSQDPSVAFTVPHSRSSDTPTAPSFQSGALGSVALSIESPALTRESYYSSRFTSPGSSVSRSSTRSSLASTASSDPSGRSSLSSATTIDATSVSSSRRAKDSPRSDSPGSLRRDSPPSSPTPIPIETAQPHSPKYQIYQGGSSSLTKGPVLSSPTLSPPPRSRQPPVLREPTSSSGDTPLPTPVGDQFRQRSQLHQIYQQDSPFPSQPGTPVTISRHSPTTPERLAPPSISPPAARRNERPLPDDDKLAAPLKLSPPAPRLGIKPLPDLDDEPPLPNSSSRPQLAVSYLPANPETPKSVAPASPLTQDTKKSKSVRFQFSNLGGVVDALYEGFSKSVLINNDDVESDTPTFEFIDKDEMEPVIRAFYQFLDKEEIEP